MNTDNLIDQLADDAGPVRALTPREGQLLLAGAAALTLTIVIGIAGLRPQLTNGTADAISLVVTALFGLLSVAAGLSAVRLAQPQVGGAQGGAAWVFAAMLLFPAISVIEHGIGSPDSSLPELGMLCLGYGAAASLITAVALTAFLRKGAPVLPEKAGFMVGLAAGSVGAFAITLECGGSSFAHLAFWHVGIVAFWALVGRFGLAHLLRW
ncbi:NrsF family protein [Sphingomicrobium sediminis]|uniref:DUF1109 domain-containing protein n=1 Tax=Sphingomicrobium sediminis TaxID=2950949 RepID=A0A9X2EGY2_9SPHN|nr:NrsF family protein [Sphingomicrobium sediminis]MCM8557226.1 DUF1109 domain-containing protein [Sphingomicrobium sediminis]